MLTNQWLHIHLDDWFWWLLWTVSNVTKCVYHHCIWLYPLCNIMFDNISFLIITMFVCEKVWNWHPCCQISQLNPQYNTVTICWNLQKSIVPQSLPGVIFSFVWRWGHRPTSLFTALRNSNSAKMNAVKSQALYSMSFIIHKRLHLYSYDHDHSPRYIYHTFPDSARHSGVRCQIDNKQLSSKHWYPW